MKPKMIQSLNTFKHKQSLTGCLPRSMLTVPTKLSARVVVSFMLALHRPKSVILMCPSLSRSTKIVCMQRKQPGVMLCQSEFKRHKHYMHLNVNQERDTSNIKVFIHLRMNQRTRQSFAQNKNPIHCNRTVQMCCIIDVFPPNFVIQGP